MIDMHQELRILEAILFASSEPVTREQLADRLPDGADIGALITDLAGHYHGHGIELQEVAGGWTFRTATDLADSLRVERKVSRKPSRAAVETLAILAYHQPVTRGEVEQIRGVAVSKGTFDVLLEAGWIRPMGRRQTPGRPVTWGTSAVFLEEFGLNNIHDLPGTDELKAAGLLDSRPASAIVGPSADLLPELPPDPDSELPAEPLSTGEPDDDADDADDADNAAEDISPSAVADDPRDVTAGEFEPAMSLMPASDG